MALGVQCISRQRRRLWADYAYDKDRSRPFSGGHSLVVRVSDLSWCWIVRDRDSGLAGVAHNHRDRCFIYPVVGIGNDCADRFGYLYLYGPGLFEPALPALGSGSARFP